MNSLFPLLYSIVLFLILLIISSYVIQQVNNTQKAEKKIMVLQKNIQSNRFSYQDNYKLGQLYLKKKLFSKAILLFREALKTWDFNDKIGLGSLYNTIGFTYFKLKQYDFAIYYYQIAIKILPDYALALKNLAYTYEKVSLYNEAFNFYKAT
uniref:Ycf37 n=1 Tax=Protohalopteris sp. TaxID=2843287 RepID=A0A8F0F768_9PHAE|nr:hypothetical protein [Protohalopteris sp.]